MSAAKSKGHPPDFARNVLQDPHDVRQQAAWVLLSAIQELFPDHFKELLAFADELRNEDSAAEGRPEAEERFGRGVCQWAAKNGVSSEVVNHVAAERALGNTVGGGVPYGYVDGHGNWLTPPSLCVDPHHEEREDFLRRAAPSVNTQNRPLMDT